MAGYLFKKYKGIYRVKADYDLLTNDFPRDEIGNIDSSFDDFYIPCANNGKIRHYEQNILFYYCPSVIRFKNILKQIYEDKIGNLDKYKTTKLLKEKEITSYDYEGIYKKLLNKQILVHIDELDFEGEFRFKTDMMNYIANLVGARTSGANISPFSTKNLPKEKYNIPTRDLNKYKKIIKPIDKIVLLAHWIKQFDDVIQAKKGNTYDINAERKLSCLSGKEYIHSIGLFDDYLEFLQDKVSEYQNGKNVR